jgi:predicted MFS family arabinose efflux permease
VRLLLLLMSISGAFGISYLAFLPAVAGGVLKSDARGLGILMACAGGGALAATLVLARRQDLRGMRTGVPVAAALFGGLLLAFSLSRSFVLSATLVAALGFAMMSQMAGTNTILQSLVPDELRGRVMSLYTMTVVGTSPLGALVIGRLSSWYGLPHVLAAGGATVMLAGLALVFPLRRALAGRTAPAAAEPAAAQDAAP